MTVIEKLENRALMKSILPVVLYLAGAFLIYFGIEQFSMKAGNFLGADYATLVQIIRGVLIGLLTTFLVFYMVYKYRFVQINASYNMNFQVASSPYPICMVELSKQEITAGSPSMFQMLGYSEAEFLNLTLKDLISDHSLKELLNKDLNEPYIDRNIPQVNFVMKSRGLLAVPVNLVKMSLLDTEILLIRCHAEKPAGTAAYEQETNTQKLKRTFQF